MITVAGCVAVRPPAARDAGIASETHPAFIADAFLVKDVVMGVDVAMSNDFDLARASLGVALRALRAGAVS